MNKEEPYLPPIYTLAKIQLNNKLEVGNAVIKQVYLLYRYFFIIVAIELYDGKEVFELRLNTWNTPWKCGYIIKTILLLLEAEECSNIADSLKGRALRLIREKEKPPTRGCIGIGHFVNDKFVSLRDLAKAGASPEELKKIEEDIH